MKKRTLICIFLTIVLAVILIFGGSPVCAAESVGSTGTAPDFTVQDSNGNAVRFSEMPGMPTVINIWATWCPPCCAELPHFEEAYRQYGDSIRFMMIDITDGVSETREDAEKFIVQNGYTFPVYFDTELEAVMAYQISAIPMSVFIDKNGVIIDEQVGSMDANTLQNYIAGLMP